MLSLASFTTSSTVVLSLHHAMSLLSPLSPQKSMPYHCLSHDTSADETETPSTSHKEQEEEEAPFLTQPHSPPCRSQIRHMCGYIVIALLSLLLGALGGQFMRVEYAIDGYPAPYGHSSRLTSIVWNANASFADEPSELTDAAWSSLIPKGRGFVIHPKLAPADGKEKKGKSVSVFHELHCLVSVE